MRYTILFVTILLLIAQFSYADKKGKNSSSLRSSRPARQSEHGYVIYTTTYIGSGSALINVHKGYAVYNRDTIEGFLHMSNDTLFMSATETPAGNVKTFTTDDTLLQTFMIYNPDSYGNLRVTRVKEYDNSFCRVLHSGKMNLYDKTFTFPSNINIQIPKLKIVIDREAINSSFSLDPKKHLIKLINKTYKLKLNPQISNDEVIGYISNLDN